MECDIPPAPISHNFGLAFRTIRPRFARSVIRFSHPPDPDGKRAGPERPTPPKSVDLWPRRGVLFRRQDTPPVGVAQVRLFPSGKGDKRGRNLAAVGSTPDPTSTTTPTRTYHTLPRADGCHPSRRRHTHRERRRRLRHHDDQLRCVFRGWLGAARHGEDLTRGAAGGRSIRCRPRHQPHTRAMAPAGATRHTPAPREPNPSGRVSTATSTGATLIRRWPRPIDRCPHRPTPEGSRTRARSATATPSSAHTRALPHRPVRRTNITPRLALSQPHLMLFAPTDHHGQSGCLIFPTLAAPVSVCLWCTARLPSRVRSPAALVTGPRGPEAARSRRGGAFLPPLQGVAGPLLVVQAEPATP